MKSVLGLDLLLLPPSIGFIDLIRIHKIVENEYEILQQLPTIPILDSSFSENNSPIKPTSSEIQSSPDFVNNPQSDDHVICEMDNSFISEHSTSSPILHRRSLPTNQQEENQQDNNRAPCSLDLIAKNLRDMKYDDLVGEDFTLWFSKLDENSKACIVTYYQEKVSTIAHVLLENTIKQMNFFRENHHFKKTASKSRVETYGGGILIVCPKLRLQEWDQYIRNFSTLKYHSYTDTLGKRRKLGAYRLSKFDIILTTFDVLRAKEILIPGNYTDVEDQQWQDEHVNDDAISWNDNESNSWCSKRNYTEGYQRSNLHLIDWSFVLLDHYNQYHHVRCGTARGDSISYLNTIPHGKKVSIIDRIDDDTYWRSSSGSVLLDISQLLKIPSYQMKKYYYQCK